MSSPTPSQASCIQDTFGIPSAVVAGAGSGKTDTLTRRIVYALEHPQLSGASDIDDILAITYTNKAASELKSRIRSALSEAATPENGLALQASKVDGAWISTIHGMCSRILRENALAFGIDPSFEVAVDEVCEQLREEALEAALSAAVHAAAGSDEALLLREYRREEIKGMLGKLVEHALDAPIGAFDNLFALSPQANTADCLLDLTTFVQELLCVVDDKVQTGQKVGKRDLDFQAAAGVFVGKVLDLPEGEDPSCAVVSGERLAQLHAMQPAQLLQLAASLPPLHGGASLAKMELDGLEVTPKMALEQKAAAVRLSVGARFLPTLVRMAQLALETYDALKRQRGLLDNGDLLRLVAHALADPANANIARRYANQFKLVMVDEFQDTNQMQIDMINLVAGGKPDVPSEKLCVVGDAQQSIYRFRNADLAVFKQHVRRVCESAQGRVIELGDNFRSHEDILSFTRGVFSRVFAQDFLDLHHGRDEQRMQQVAPYMGGAVGEDASLPRRVNVKVFGTKGARGISERAAQAIAEDFKALYERGNRPGEMAILLGKMTNAGTYAAALQRVGLKCAITGGTVFKDSNDAAVVADLVAALANPLDSEALADVLTSDLFCLEAADLLQLVSLREGAQGALGDIFAQLVREADKTVCSLFEETGLGAPSAQLESAIEVLYAAATHVGSARMSTLVQQVLVNSGWFARLNQDDISRAADVLKAVRILRALEDGAPVGARQLAEQFRARLRVAKEAPGVLSAKGDDFVRIMTIHASKGLSIPIVAVAEADFSPARSQTLTMVQVGQRMFLALDAGASVRSIASSNLVYKSLRSLADGGGLFANESEALQALEECAHEQKPQQVPIAEFYAALRFLDLAADLEEHQRKLYVAYTRAKEALIAVQASLPAKPRQRANGGMQANEAIAELLTGSVADATFAKAEDAVQQIVTLPVLDAATGDATWEARLQVYPLIESADESDLNKGSESGNEVSGADATPAPVSAPAPAPASASAPAMACPPTGKGAYPQEGLLLYEQLPVMGPVQGEQPYRAQWAQGILSASSLKADADAGAQGEDATETSPCGEELSGILPGQSECAAGDGEADLSTDALLNECESVPLSFDEDEEPPAPANDRGTAFHALCEWAALHRDDAGCFTMPPERRQHALAQLYGLNAQQETELPTLLNRWLSSPQAAFAASHAHVCPEFPFWVQLQSATATRSQLVLEGFIDLLAFDQPNTGSAYVIDYKTGTGYNTDAKRRSAYKLQAACYAYALMMQGFQEVQLDFVFVDQPDPDNPAKPIVVRFPAQGEPAYTLEQLHQLIAGEAQ